MAHSCCNPFAYQGMNLLAEKKLEDRSGMDS